MIVISSSVHSQVRMVDLNSVVTGAPLTPDSYRTSKLLNILFVHELARRLEGTGIMANAVDQLRSDEPRAARCGRTPHDADVHPADADQRGPGSNHPDLSGHII